MSRLSTSLYQGHDTMNVDPIEKESPKNGHPFSGEKDKEQASPASNGFLIKNSRFMYREIRDHRMIRSPRHDDFIVAKIHDDLIEKLSQEYICTEIHDPLLDESPKIQELVSHVTWKRDLLKGEAGELLKICVDSREDCARGCISLRSRSSGPL